MKEIALLVAAVIFLIVSLMHLGRLILKLEVKVGKFIIPLWVSAFGFAVALLLSLWMFKVKGGC